MHGDLASSFARSSYGRFKRRQIQLLVATDIASRGIDVDELTHVFHYDSTETLKSIYRSGRTGRAGRHGQSGLFVEPRDQQGVGVLS